MRSKNPVQGTNSLWQWTKKVHKRGAAIGIAAIVMGLGASSANALVRFDNFRGSVSVPSPVIQPSYANYSGGSSPVQLQNLINFSAGPPTNIASSGTAANINWLSASQTLCHNNNLNSQACKDRLQGRVTYALVKFPVAGTYYFGAAHDDEIKVEFSTTFASMDPASYRHYDYNVPVGSVNAWTSGDNSYETIPGNFVVSQAGACYAMRIYWNNQGGLNLLRLGWRTSTPPASPKAADYPFIPDENLRDPADASSYADCATVDTDLAIDKAGPATFEAGVKFNPGYTITLWNKGPNPVSNATFADTIPASLNVGAGGFTCTAFDSNGAQMGAGTANIKVTNNGKAYAVTMGGLLGVNASDQVPSSGARLVCTVDVTSTADPGYNILNTATITVNDRDPTNNTSSATSSRADIVSVTKSGPTSALVGESFTYQLTLLNNSTSAKTGVMVQDQLPPGVTATAASAPGGSVSCNNLNTAGALLTCTVASSIPRQGTQDILLTVVAASKQAITNYAATHPLGSGPPPSSPGPLCNAATTSCDKASTTVLGDPQLTLSKEASVGRAPAGASVSYTLKVSNTGQIASGQHTTIVDTIPVGIIVENVNSMPGFTCSANEPLPLAGDGVGTQVVCASSAGIPAGATGVVVAVLETTKSIGQDVTNSASITQGDSTCPAAERCNASVTVGGTPQLQINKAATPVVFAAGQPAAYTITVTNVGNAPTTEDATVTDAIDANLTIGEVSPGCDVSGQNIACHIPAGLPTNTPITFTVNVTPGAVSDGTRVHNSATVQGGGDPACAQAGPCSSSVEVPVVAPKLVITKAAMPSGAFVVGQQAQYVLQVTNVGNAVTTNQATVTDTLSDLLTLGPLPNGCEATGPKVTCTVPAGLEINMPKTFVIPVIPKPDADGLSIANVASIHGGGDPSCLAENECISNEIRVPVNAPHLMIQKEASAQGFTVGVPAFFTLRVTNTGTAPTTSVAVVSDTVASLLEIDTSKLAEQGCSAEGQIVTCTLPPGLETNAPHEFKIWVTPLPDAANKSVANAASISGGGDPSCIARQRCDSNQVEIPVMAPSLVVEKKASAEAFQVGVPAHYTLTVRNQGSAPTTVEAKVSDVFASVLEINAPLPSGCTQGAGAQVNMVTCTVEKDLAVGGSREFIIRVTPLRGAGQTIVNKANVMGGGDPSCATGTACESEEVYTPIDSPSLVIQKSASAETLVVGQPAQYTLKVSNNGSAPTTAPATVTDTVASALEVDTATLPSGCSFAVETSTLTCQIPPPLAAGASQSFEFTVRPKPSALGRPVTNKAEVVGGGDPSCVSACDSNEVTVTVTSPKLEITKSASTDPFIVGEQASYTLTVKNTGDAATTANATVTDTLANGLTALSADGCSIDTQTISCTIPAGLLPGTSRAFTIQVMPTASAETPLMNFAGVSGGGDPLCEESCQSNHVIIPVARPQIVVSKEATGIQRMGDQKYVATYVVTVLNQGTASGIYTLTDTPHFANGVTLDRWEIRSSDGTVNPGLTSPPGNNLPHQISGADVALASGSSHTYTVALTFSSSPTASNLECVVDSPGHGAYNQADISGSTTDSAFGCTKIPSAPTPVPVDSNTMLFMLGLLLMLAAGWRLSDRRR